VRAEAVGETDHNESTGLLGVVEEMKMNGTRSCTAELGRCAALAAVVALALVTTAAIPALAEDDKGVTHDGLKPLEDAKVAKAYVHPEADFSAFKRVTIVEAYVAFRSNWQQDQNRSRTRKILPRDMDRIRTGVAALFKEVFTERLEAGGYQVVDGAAEDVLLLRPAIIDLDVTAPDLQRGGRTATYVASSGAATLLLELYDSVSGQILGRAVDRQVDRSRGSVGSWTTGARNQDDARRIFQGWADQLVEFLHSHYMKK
jgi:hypothetical protein